MKNAITDYRTLRAKLRTGDIVLFSGRGVLSWIIRLLCLARTSHVGMVVCDRMFDRVLLLESDLNERKSGVQMNNLGERIAGYNGHVCIRRLKPVLTPLQCVEVRRFIVTHRNTSYEQGIGGFLEILAASKVIGWLWRNKPNTNEFFCSELVATIYQRLGLLPKGKPANEYTPSDFELGGNVDKALALLPQPTWLGEEIWVK